MNISGIRTYAGFYDYNTIKNQEAGNRQLQDIKEVEAPEVLLEETERESSADVTIQSKDQGPDSGALEYTKQYQPQTSYELIGRESEIAALDVEQAISDMKKDQVLQQYQFFVGESRAGENLDRLRTGENFLL